MVAKRKQLYMHLYKRLLKSGKYATSRNILHNLIGLEQAKKYLPDINFWCMVYDIDLQEWFKNG